MNFQEISHLLRHPEQLGRTHFFDLESLVLEKPWFAAGHVLLAKAAKNMGHPGYERFESRAAAYVNNLEAFKKFLESHFRNYEVPQEYNPEPAVPVMEDEVADAEVLETIDGQPEIIPEHLGVEDFLQENDEEIVKLPEMEAEVTETFSAIEDNDEESAPAEDFFSWLAQISHQSYLPRPKEKPESAISSHSGPKPAADQHVTEIIDRFIETNPTITRSPRKMYNPAEYAKLSEEDNELIISETLAKVYAEQKLYHKAIAAYEKLMLLKPEKKDIFAALIKTLQEETKS